MLTVSVEQIFRLGLDDMCLDYTEGCLLRGLVVGGGGRGVYGRKGDERNRVKGGRRRL